MSPADYVPFAAPSFGQQEVEAVTRVVRGGWVSTGPEAEAFEAEFAAYVGARHALAVSSCTAALHLAMLALGVRSGEAIVPATTFTATAAAVVHAGATPRLADVDPVTLNLTVETATAALRPTTRAILPVHFAGRMADLRGLRELADRHGLLLIEDAAHALPAWRDGCRAGQVGDAAAFSFFATKPITSAEGGMLCTREEVVADTARVWSLHGISKEAVNRYRPGGSALYEVHHPGFKYNLSDLHAALGRAQLARADELHRRRRQIAARYLEALGDVAEVELPPADHHRDHSAWYLFVIRLVLERLTIDREAFCDELHARGVGTSVHFKPLHLFDYWRETAPRATDRLTNAEATYPRLVSLPIFPAMTPAAVERVAETVRSVCRDRGR
jgi:dTDP-4-amino-4,6-dideoxygalactose transaminase